MFQHLRRQRTVQSHKIRRIHLGPIHPILPLPIPRRKPLRIDFDLDLPHLNLHLPHLPALDLLPTRLERRATLAKMPSQIGPAAKHARHPRARAPLALEAGVRVPLGDMALQVAGAGAGVRALRAGERLLLQVRAGVVLGHDRLGREAALAHGADVRSVQRVRPGVPHDVGGEAEGRAHGNAAVACLPAAVAVLGYAVLGFEVGVQSVWIGEDEVAWFEGGVEPEAFVGLGGGAGRGGRGAESGAESGGGVEGGGCHGRCRR